MQVITKKHNRTQKFLLSVLQLAGNLKYLSFSCYRVKHSKLHSMLFFLPLVFSNCNSCLNKFYAVHEEATPINITFEKNKESIPLIKKCIDSLNFSNRKDSSLCSPSAIKLEKDDKIICFTNPNCECCLISFKGAQLVIGAVYLPGISNQMWLTKKEQIDDAELNRIAFRFKAEVLDRFK